LPRLAEPEHFHGTKHGYARGFEAQRLVDNVRNYYDILARMSPRDATLASENRAPAPQLSTKPSPAGR
jgi:membrane-bound lytic murein transglycosylase MltF